MTEKDNKALTRINEEINKINNKEFNIYFFVIDSKGNPSGSLSYIYKLALILSENGYNVGMLYQDDEFIGVKDWLGEEYANIPHYNVNNGDVNISVSDILFIPEIFASVMNQTKKLPCKRIAILQNFNFLTEFIPLSIQWGDYGIVDCITQTKQQSDLIKSYFPYVKTSVIPPYIDDSIFYETDDLKDLYINIVSQNDQSYINRIVKPFYWKYPAYRWVSFKDLRGLSQENFANELRKGCITIWVDTDTNFGYTPIEAMKCGSIVIAKIPNDIPEWAKDENGNLLENIVWFDNVQDLHSIIANLVIAWTYDNVPKVIKETQDKVISLYNKENTINHLLYYINNITEKRKNEMISLISTIKKDKE